MDRTNERLRFYLLLCVPFIWALSNSMMIPVLPRIQQVLGISKVQAGLLITALSVPTAIFLPVTGFLSDRFGRLAVMVPSLLLYGSGGLLGAAAGLWASYPLLLVARGIQGLGATGTTLVAMSFAGDLYEGSKRRKVLGYLESTNSLGKLASPLLGTAVASLLWYAPFLVYPLLCYPLALGLFLVRNQTEHNPSTQTLSSYFHALSKTARRKSWPYAVSLWTAFVAVFIWFGNLFYLSETMASRFGLPGMERGLLLSIPIVTLALTAIVTGKYLRNMSPVLLLCTGLLGIGVTLLVTLVLPPSFLLYGSVALVGVGLGTTLPALNTLIISAVPEEERGVVAAIYGSVRAMGSALGPVAFGFTMDRVDTLPLALAGVLAILTALLGYLFIKEEAMMET